ncbi:YjgN family protein [Massilia pinisoli]|uniref:YjgN family protein n=1 Tax=Massilia pinisoli TaxID=1772194 RepID=A0ABT1ZNM0_9BURK|nr:YjgN family protein [Massilia pinisoli]MCS0581506.1 YjgN family protein [Massilia pinisoli]
MHDTDDSTTILPPTVAAETSHGLTFSGSGAEYFRIWIVNLLLTVATLGIYSAWAKTRRLQYFYRNTQLAGAGFDFRGDPKAILRGRILAVVVLAAYHYAFGFSLNAGMVTIALLLIGVPFMMRSALRFRLSNTVYRGLPFGFSGSVTRAYLVYLVPVAIFVLPGALLALNPKNPWAGAVFLLYLAWPLIHGAMRTYQHKHLMVGDQQATFPLGMMNLAKPYLIALLMWLGVIVLSIVVGIVAAILAGGKKATDFGTTLPFIIGMAIFYIALLLPGPYIVVRLNNRAWSATSFPGVRITCAMQFWPYLRLQVVNVLLTLLTLGLFRPFAAVRTWRYRVEHVTVDTPDGFEQAVLAARRPAAAAAGDGVADFLGVDLSW